MKIFLGESLKNHIKPRNNTIFSKMTLKIALSLDESIRAPDVFPYSAGLLMWKSYASEIVKKKRVIA